ncbi:hypothetical protein MMC32_003805 [Xylographa parallela]|nr:hypothetical protein [Xylographa parallela]
MSARSAESNRKSSTAECEPARALTKKHVDLGRWTGDSCENGVDKNVETLNEEEAKKQKDKETEQNMEGVGDMEKKDAEAEAEPTPPPTNPMPPTPSRPFPRRKLTDIGARTEEGTETGVWREVVRSVVLH